MPLETNPPVDRDTIDLEVATEKVCHIIVRARAFDAKEGDADPDSGSNPADDGMGDVLENQPGDATHRELHAFIRALNTARSEHSNRTAEYLLGLPLLNDYLEEGLAMFNEGCDDFNARL